MNERFDGQFILNIDRVQSAYGMHSQSWWCSHMSDEWDEAMKEAITKLVVYIIGY